MKRVYYADALAAAWMEKHFGMKFQGELYGKPMQNLVVWCDCIRNGNLLNANDSDCDDPLIHIHPNSLHLLDPHNGDAVEFDRWHWDRQRYEDMKDVSPQPHYARVRIDSEWKHIASAGIGWDMATLNEPFSLPFKIIQRNGISFHWPEFEE